LGRAKRQAGAYTTCGMHPFIGKHRAIGVFVSYGLLAVLLAAAGPARAWGPATHAYIASQVFPNAPPTALFGAMAADMNDFSAWNDSLASNFKHLTHFEAGLLPSSPFQLGMLTHSSDWGGDSYAHAYFHVPTDKLYPMCLYEQLSREIGISMNDAEDVIETLMDYVICRDLGPAFIQRIADAADAAGPAEEQALIDAFTEPLMQKMPEFSRDRAVDSIRLMFRCDKSMLKQTAELMSMPAESLLRIAPILLAAGLDMDSAKAVRAVQYSIELCADWRPHLDEISQEIAAKMKTLHLIGE
jgi:hypothetical protein